MSLQPLKEKHTPLRWEELEALSRVQRRRKLLERMASSVEGRRRFWEKVKAGKSSECWPWISTVFNDGENYGQLRLGFMRNGEHIRYKYRAHRVAYLLIHGVLPDDMCVCHTCDNPICVNPGHLFLGTNKKNIQDRTNKKRDARGEGHGRHKLTEEQVLYLRRLRVDKNLPYSALGKMFGITTTQAGWIVRRQSWKHLT